MSLAFADGAGAADTISCPAGVPRRTYAIVKRQHPTVTPGRLMQYLMPMATFWTEIEKSGCPRSPNTQTRSRDNTRSSCGHHALTQLRSA